MFRVKINIGAILHEDMPSAAGKETVNRLGDWADEMNGTHPKLTKEDVCKTFRDKFQDSGDKGNKTVA